MPKPYYEHIHFGTRSRYEDFEKVQSSLFLLPVSPLFDKSLVHKAKPPPLICQLTLETLLSPTRSTSISVSATTPVQISKTIVDPITTSRHFAFLCLKVFLFLLACVGFADQIPDVVVSDGSSAPPSFQAA